MVVSYGLIFRAFSESRKNIPMTAAFYEIATARPIEQFPDYWCAVSALSNSALNPIFLMAFDSRIRANVIKMFSGNSDSI
ncbi:hypothetical protein EDD86DRAFT_248501 [Gorgonomyces haynaldii]|nr:hypothetical protein EDD86DRAFT_248501 [Gorgonomyces haynaldii]